MDVETALSWFFSGLLIGFALLVAVHECAEWISTASARTALQQAAQLMEGP